MPARCIYVWNSLTHTHTHTLSLPPFLACSHCLCNKVLIVFVLIVFESTRVRQKECLPIVFVHVWRKTLFLSHTCALKDNENKDNENFVTKTNGGRHSHCLCTRVLSLSL